MISRLGLLGLVWLLVLTVEAALPRLAAAAERGELEPSPILVRIDFEDESPSGPDTFRLFERPSGRVELSEAFRVSGSRSLRLQEGRGDGSFSEFLGSIPLRRQGPLLVRFYILFADPNETFNFALAGPRWFKSFVRDGHAFWLATEGGRLLHHPASGWRELFAPRPFTWYLVDLLLDLDGGTYDLAIYEEGLKEPRVDVRRQQAAGEAFYGGDLDLARELLERLLAEPARAERVLLKLADVYHLRGWVEEERSARERIYGRLRLGQ